MKASRVALGLLLLLSLSVVLYDAYGRRVEKDIAGQGREEVVFWHFWGGEDLAVVEDVVERFNASQEKYFVRAIAMPGNNLDVKLFLAVTGGDPPDVINQDDPIVADWAHRGALTPLDELASPEEMAELNAWLFPAAKRLCQYDGRLYGLCNGLDIRALYYNKTLFDEHPDLPLPKTPDDLMTVAERLAVVDESGRRVRFGYLPDSRRLWAWGIAFGGTFHDPQTGATANDPALADALSWMQRFSRKFGADEVAIFRQGDLSLPGKTFPLLPVSTDTPHGRYGMILDGQWRVRDINRSREARLAEGLPVAEYGVLPLPAPPGGRQRAGWVNGNFFVVPRGARNRDGAWQFMKFWSGFENHEGEAAKTCAAGGWIPVSQQVVDRPEFQQYLQQQPLFAEFVDLAGSPNQFPIPVIPGAQYFNREIKGVGGAAMQDVDASAAELLDDANQHIQSHLERVRK